MAVNVKKIFFQRVLICLMCIVQPQIGFAHQAHSHAPVDPNNVPNTTVVSLLKQVALYDQTGRHLSFEDLSGRPLLVNFMYTSCVEICGLQTYQLRNLQNLIADIPTKKRPLFVSISLDPDTDTSDKLRDYASRFSIDTEFWLFTSGDKSWIASLASALWIGDTTPSTDGQFDHRMILHLLDGDLEPIQRYRSNPIDLGYLASEIRNLAATI